MAPAMVAQPSGQNVSLTMPSLCHLEPPSVALEIDHQATRKLLLASLRGQTIRIPDLKPLFSHWSTRTNPEVSRLRVDIQDWLSSTVAPGRTLDALLNSDFGLFGATWWPCAQYDKLLIVTYLAVWLFTWDDEIDLSNGAMWDDFGAAQSYRDHTLAYVRYSLGMDEQVPSVKNRTILNFEPIGRALKQAYTLDQRKMVYEEMRFFMEMSEEEQRLRLAGTVSSLHEFWHYRLGSSAVTVCLALNEYSWGSSSSPSSPTNLPREFYLDQDVRGIIRYTNTIISATNDLLSIKKEIKRDAIDSLLPIIFFQVGDIQTAVNDVVEFIRLEIQHMDAAVASLLKRYDLEPEEMRTKVRNFVDGCKHYATGNLSWSLETDRYGVDYIDGQVVMVL